MKALEVYDLIKNIVKKSSDLKNKYTGEIDAKVNYACVFCKGENGYNDYIEALKNDGNIVIKDTYSGPLFKLKGVDTVAGKLMLFKVRRHDEKHQDLGDADFTIKDYEAFKMKYKDHQNFKLITGEGYEMIELMGDENDVRAYFSNPPLDEELGITSE